MRSNSTAIGYHVHKAGWTWARTLLSVLSCLLLWREGMMRETLVPLAGAVLAALSVPALADDKSKCLDAIWPSSRRLRHHLCSSS